MFYFFFGYSHLREIDKKGFGFSQPAVFGGQPNTMLANRKESYKSLQLTFPFQPHTAPLSVSRSHLARNGSNFDLFPLVGYFAMMVLNRRNGRFLSLLYLFRLFCIFERTSEQQPTFRIVKRKSREKKCRTQIEQSEQDKPYCKRD